MKLLDAKKDYFHLSILSLILCILLSIRRLVLFRLDFLGLILGFFWPIVSFLAFIKLYNKDGHAINGWEIIYLLLCVYCSFYFLLDMLLEFIFYPGFVPNLIIMIFNLTITAIGWIGFYLYFF